MSWATICIQRGMDDDEIERILADPTMSRRAWLELLVAGAGL